MSSWRSNSLAVLALAAGALSPCAMPPSARAGDKIEFSAPGASLEVPQVVRDDKEPPKYEFQVPMQAGSVFPEAGLQYSSEIVIVTTPKVKEAKRRDSVFTDNRDDNTNADSNMDADSLYDNLDSRPQSINGATNQWEMPGGWKPDAGSIYSERRRNEAAGQDSLRTRLEAVNTAEGTDYQKEERYGRRSFDSDEDPAWSSGFFNRALPSEKTMTQRLSAWSYNLLHPGLPGLQQRLQDKIMPSYAAMKAINEQSKELNEQFSREYSSERLSSASGDQPHGSLLSPDAEYISERNAARARMSDETVSAPRTILPAETTTVSQNPGVFARQEPPASPRGQVQSRPAILPFPKKPGSVFQ